MHAAGLSLGSADGVDDGHLKRVARLVDQLQPALVSEHLSWGGFGGPFSLHEEALESVARNISRVQDRLGRQVSIENSSSYLGFRGSTLTEAEFLGEFVRSSGCGLLLDINNVAVTAHDLGLDLADWLNELPGEAIAQLHWAGQAGSVLDDDSTILIHDHGSCVCDEVWSLFDRVLQRFDPRPTRIEWDTAISPLIVLLNEGFCLHSQSASDGVRKATLSGRE